MKKGILLAPLAGAVAAVVALGVMSGKPWSKDTTLGKKKINYCLLIGQTDHNDSQARTKGVREALHTRDLEKYGDDSNPNTESPTQGKLKFKMNDTNEEVEYEVNELESKTCIADSGATWDQSTAIKISNTWYSKYQDNLTMIVSNNDGMAEGALFSLFRPEGMPIFGYDSNASTVQLIKNGKIKGTINSNAPAQAAVINIIARRIIDNVKLEKKDGHLVTADGDGTGIKITWNSAENKYEYDYTGTGTTVPLKSLKDNLFKGFYFGGDSSETGEKYSKTGDGKFVCNGKYICDFVTPKEGPHASITFKYDAPNHALLVSSNIVKQENITDFEKDEKEQANDDNSNTIKTEKKGDYSFFNCCYSKTDTYLKSTFLPLYDQFRDKFGIEKTSFAEGNGNDEKETLNAIPATKKDAYIINMTHTNNAGKYLEKIKDVTGEDYVKTPIIFYNRQPTAEDGKPDSRYMDPTSKENGGNPFVFYVGFDANAGAVKQGEMITEWLGQQIGGTVVKEEK